MSELKGIKVTVQTEERLKAITTMAKAINNLSKALIDSAPKILINGCVIKCVKDSVGINVEKEPKVHTTLIEKM